MSLIHCRKRDGRLTYRLWSSMCDRYLTSDLTEEQLKKVLVAEAERDARTSALAQLPERLERAQRKGTSEAFGVVGPEPLEQPWEEERKS